MQRSVTSFKFFLCSNSVHSCIVLQCVTSRYGHYVITLPYVALQVLYTLHDVIVIGKNNLSLLINL